MLLFLDSLQGERVVREGILDVSEVGLVRDYFFAAGLLEHFGSQLQTLLVICHHHHLIIATTLAVVINIALAHIGQPFVDEATQFECCVVLKGEVWRQSGLVLRLVHHFGIVDDLGGTPSTSISH